MNAVPKYISANKLDPSLRYICPACRVQKTSDENDTGWTNCPLTNEKAICLGCCLDIQTVARDVDFDENPYRDLFNEIKNPVDRDVRLLRQICLNHQIEILNQEMTKASDSDVLWQVESLLKHVVYVSDRIKQS